MAQSAKSNESRTSTDVSNQMAVLREDVSKLTELVAEYGKAQSEYMTREAANTASKIADASKDAAVTAQVKAQDALHDAEELVRQNPAAAVGVAVGVGVLLGLLTSRR